MSNRDAATNQLIDYKNNLSVSVVLIPRLECNEIESMQLQLFTIFQKKDMFVTGFNLVGQKQRASKEQTNLWFYRVSMPNHTKIKNKLGMQAYRNY